ncbi:3-hydroxyacyl-CoA dehydrogenase NAD-binding domain-containing protein [Paenarthrobacter nicotinovorans]|uniref:3-hydroxyacyl-CoA dehydrogenase NAD-binding domain-containing protein n=1 Tax=Paenarthrobacter nicotinovorans TaxID=29320 RepID=UPI00166F162E|nr:3-hydroxyacyl-CoA dehydrogenase NAD-binding domain-containing protein [Paenarthrobacter nicotinovorans]MBP2392884.1 3-hydroxyacyl-CoA dehydrogenase/enoyl-CoA hydratase/carnithine racemase [Paenarthrobacter nicotinovorans]UKF00822.1 3-hydroxyacyl-CoA dehydrogenase NAD-binding domain-containing protein [Paenarthrobacter nicotinovorans]UKF05603.1 3-hydroxyacyl-CoA dehydrogenase NAD-binding domain-containing protein [Paenarthrobacter nicotinovorans]GGV28841.1 3-hydroxyacyl-CoA dehydrogenase [Pae
MSAAEFQKLAALFPDEVVTHSYVQDIQLPGGVGTFALITLDNGLDHSKPTTLGPNTLVELGSVLDGLKERASRGEIVGVGVTGKPYFLVAGADLSAVKTLKEREHGLWMAQLGHAVYATLADLGVPSFAFINGLALGGGLEIALQSTYRTVSTGAGALALPEAFIGLVPGWGGVYILPRLIGPENAVKVMIENPLSNNRTLTGPQAYELGIADAIFEPADFVEQSLAWAARVISGEEVPERKNAVEASDDAVAARWAAAVAAGRAFDEAKTSNASPAPAKVLDVMEANRTMTQQESAELECETLAGLMQTDEFRSTVYAFLDLVQKRSKRPAGAPDRKLARPVTKIGVVGAGLMASQLALLFARQLKVPVVMTDIDQARVDKGVAYVHSEVDKMLAKKRIKPDAANRTKALVTGSVSKEAFADADFVIEAVFEELHIKKQVFAEVEEIVSPECILATNTSSLSVTAMAEDLKHPERLVGFHFFNPVAVMPLLEIVKAPKTDDPVLATAFELAKGLKKTAVLVKDAAAFVVNRILLRLMGEVIAAFDEGTPAEVADTALRPMGLPMSPFTLSAMVGLPVAQHVQESLHTAFGDRFPVSQNLQKLIDNGVKSLWVPGSDGKPVIPAETLAIMSFGNTPSTGEEVLRRTQDALAEEIGLMLEEGVVAGPEDIDLCVIMGAGWPMFLGGITPYLDRVGASERVNGKRFLAPGVASAPA